MFINRQLISFSRGSGRRIALTSFLEFLLTEFATLVALCSAFIVRMLMGETRILFFTHISQIFICIFILIGIRFVLAKIKVVEATKCGIQIKDNLRSQLLQKLFLLGPAYTGKKRTGDIATTIFSKVDWLNNYYTIYLPTVISAIFNAIIIITVLFTFDWLTALVCIIASLGVLGCPMLFFNVMAERGKKEWEAHTTYYGDCLDGIQGIASLKAFNANDRQKNKISKQGETLRQSVMEQLKITMIENGVLEFFARLGGAFSIAVAAWRYVDGNIQKELLVYALFLIGACFVPMLSLLSAWHMGYRGVTASFGIATLLDEPVQHSSYVRDEKDYLDKKLQQQCHQFTGDICFENVSFAYNQKEGDTIKDVSFNIPNKTMTALVGPSGGGKSTIAHLLAGFYPIDRGCVRVGEDVLTTDSVDKIQNLISVVWQDSHIFYGTAYENILIGDPRATKDEVIKAAKEAHIHEFIESLPEGYQTILGERGMRFSGGERQRIAIARAFLRNSPIIIFDEATSALDRKNEIEIQKSFKKLSEGKTVLVIAHRLATIQNANQICIVESGEVKDFGTHQELVNSSELYKKLMGNQIMSCERGLDYEK